MKKVLVTSVLVAIMATTISARWGHYGHDYRYHKSQSTQVVSELSQEQKDDLTFMYQEEKLARDVYTTLGNIWNARVFKNIQRSEQRHMNSIKYILNKYNLPIPILSDDIGVFENEELQSLYNELIEKGKVSLQNALEVGVAIEEKDIADLEAKIIDTPSDITRVFSNLTKGSYHHLKAFNNNLGNLK